MAAKKRKNTGDNQLNLDLKDERVPKLLGVLCLFIALYLFIAFTSYLFTWQIDQDRVLRFSWSLLFQGEFIMANWLGRLGAIISNLFFYWGFGLPSYIFVFMLAILGTALLKNAPLRRFVPVFRYGIIFVLLLSILLDFIFSGSLFPWGGAFGDGISGWLHSFVGTAGMVFLFIFLFLGVGVWMFNPDFNEITFKGLFAQVKLFFQDLITGRRFQRVKPVPIVEEMEIPEPLESVEVPKEPVIDAVDEPTPEVEEVLDEEVEEILSKGDQLALRLKGKAGLNKNSALKIGDDALEINTEDIPTDALGLEDNTPIPSPSGMPHQTLSVEEENKSHIEPYDPTLELSMYESPVTALLNDYENAGVEIDRAELEANKDQIIETLLNYKIEIVKIRATIGPTVTLYEIVPAPGVRISKIKNLEDDIALSLSALGIRIIAPIPGRGTIGIEVPNKRKQIVSLKEVLMSDKFKRAKMDLPIALGKTISNEVFVADLAKMPHLLIAGATGQGKSVGINVILMSLLYKKHPSQVKLVMIDPKKVELFPYAKIEQHFLAYLPGQDEPITTETTKVIHTLNSLCIEMDQRYDLLKKAHSRNITEYNDKFINRRLNPNNGHHFLPFIVLVIDEFADLIMTAGKEVELPIGRLAQLARAVGIHLVIATQRPSVNIITGVIKANFPARIAYKVTSKVDSRTILDGGGADQLIGRGDMLLSVGGEMVRLQCAFVDTPEVERVIDYIAKQPGYPEPYFLPEFHSDDDEIQGTGGLTYGDLDDLFEDAARLIVQNQHGSTSMIQRRLRLGYNRAGRIMDQLEAMGIVGQNEGSKAREVLVYDEVELEKYLEALKTRR